MQKITTKPQEQLFNGNEVFTLKRRDTGLTEVHSKSKNALAYAQALCHCEDRFMQMFLLRIIGQGRICELLQDNEESLKIDIFMRQMEFYNSTAEDVQQLSLEIKKYFQSYADGVNHYLSTRGGTWEFKLLRVHLEPWVIQDSLMVIKLMSYLGLAQTQQDAEKFIIQSVRENIDIAKLKSLFSPHLDGMSEEIISDLKDLHYFEGLIPDEIKFNTLLPKMMASNNWIISPKKSVTGGVTQANDPHLEVNRLPGVWYEQVLHINEKSFQGVSMPGLPGIIMGRTDRVSFGFTYGFMDMIDYFVEDVTNEQFLRDGEYESLDIREELIVRKRNKDVSITIYENECGTLETDPFKKGLLENGKYLNRAWSAKKCGAFGSATALYEMLEAQDVHQMKEAVSKISISCNWLLGDTDGNIAYQQSGICPVRAKSGLYPLRASDKLNLWAGVIDPSKLSSVTNPVEGFLSTANDDLNTYLEPGSPLTINLPMGPYRIDRINQLLREKETFSVDDFKKMQGDLYSIQAHIFMDELRPLLAKDKVSEILLNWDLCYDKNSLGATVFEEFYKNLLAEVFTKDFYPSGPWSFTTKKSSILIDFYHLFDRIIIEDNPLWFNKISKMECYKNAIAKTQKHYLDHKIKKWGELRKVKMKNIFFDGKLPAFLGFDYGPISLQGSRATIVQGAIYESHGRESTFCPSMRFITDLSTRKSYTVLAGGVSDRRFSGYYTSEIEDWLNFKYKEVSLD